jgi:tyrosinase
MQRRQFIKASTLLGTAAVLPTVSIATETRGPTRKSLLHLPPDAKDLISYERAVGIMRCLPGDDPRSWTAQANIHIHCPHYNWWFLPWHRAYLHYFEEVCRELLQDPSFALPYWDWTRFPYLPTPFLNRNSSLWQDGRNFDGLIKIDFGSVGTPTMEGILKTPNCGDFFGDRTKDPRDDPRPGYLEATPHATVHSKVGGVMAIPETSAQDPIFWLHHCNVDRIWESWMKIHGGAVPEDELWAKQCLGKFYDPARHQKDVCVQAGQTIKSAQFGAVYDVLETFFGYDPAVPLQALQIFFGAQEHIQLPKTLKLKEQLSLTDYQAKMEGNRTTFSLGITPTFQKTLDDLLKSPLDSQALPLISISLLLDNMPIPKTPTTAVRVFLNTPDASVNTPFDDPGYITTVSFFGGHNHRESHPPPSFSFNITTNIAKLRNARREVFETFVITLVSIDLLSPWTPKADEAAQPSKVRIIAIGPADTK